MKENMGARLKKIREKRNLTQPDLAADSKVSQQAISNMERRNGQASVFLFKLADALEVNPRWLLTGEGESWVDTLQAQLNEIYSQLDRDRRDSLLFEANKLLSEQKKAPGPHDPFHKAQKRPQKAPAGKKAPTA